ncbi:MAG: PorP/SprF family type IX secretion system membrane protein [Pelagibacterales bacterium]|nr:PorP/SprF family type IX secretion system membrane protein [Pelagibacterales bacterium]
MKQLFFIISMVLAISTFAQQEPLFTQYYVNDMVINPAVSGSKTYNPLTIQTRQQWLGFEGAPLTSNISYHGALNDRSAMGGYLMFDKAYPTTQANLHLNYAYHIPLDYDKVNLSFGLGAKVMYHNLDFNEEDLPPGYDLAFSTSSHEEYLGDASSGVYLYGSNFYTGFSVSNMLESSFNTAVSGSPYPNSELRIYYGMGAYRFNIINNDWQLEPSFLIRKMHFQSSMTDLTTRILYLENTWGGLTYRTNGTAILSMGFGTENMNISYSYDHTFAGEIMPYTYGTHELGISFRINNGYR